MTKYMHPERIEFFVRWLRISAEKCCQCTDGHHDQSDRPYGTDSEVHISRDHARELADLLESLRESKD